MFVACFCLASYSAHAYGFPKYLKSLLRNPVPPADTAIVLLQGCGSICGISRKEEKGGRGGREGEWDGGEGEEKALLNILH